MTATKSKKSTSSSRSSPADRFQARRMAVERHEGLRRLRLVLGLTVVSTFAIATIGFFNSAAFNVDEVAVAGSDRSDPDLIIAESGIEVGQGLLEVDMDGAVEAVEMVPWVGTAEVDRDWTGVITINVVERGPSIVLPAGDRFALVDDHGRQLEIVDRRPDGFMPILGIEGSGVPGEPAPAETVPLIALLDALPEEIESQITGVVVSDGQLQLDLSVGGTANFGDGSDLGLKLQSLETLLATVDLSCLDTIDLRVPSAPAVTRRSGLAGTEATTGGDSVESGGLTAESNAEENPDSDARYC